MSKKFDYLRSEARGEMKQTIIPRQLLYCKICGEKLRPEVGRGWVHISDGTLMRMKTIEKNGIEITVEDHTAFPDWQNKKEWGDE